MNAVALQVHPRLRTIEMRRVFLLGLGGLVMGGGVATFAVWRIWTSIQAAGPWQDELSLNRLPLAFGCLFLTGLVGTGTWREIRVSLTRLTLTAELAKNGQLTIVDLLSSSREDKGFRVMHRYRFRAPGGAVLEGSIAYAEGGAYRVAESPRKSLALLSRDGQQAILLTRSGYPILNAAEALARASASAG